MTELEQLEQNDASAQDLRAAPVDLTREAAIAVLRPKLAAPPAARQPVTVLFAELAVSPFQQEARDEWQACLPNLTGIVKRFGGLSAVAGTELCALFQSPFASESDAASAVCAARAILDSFSPSPVQGLVLPLRLGIETGLLSAGDATILLHQEPVELEDLVNTAVQMANLAGPGEALVGADTYRLTASQFDYQILDPIMITGRARLTPVYRLLGTRPEPEQRQEPQGLRSPLVGRNAEVGAFGGALDRLLGGQGGIILLMGGAGLGKSRLVAEMRNLYLGNPPAVDSPLLWLEGRTLSFAQGISYWPFQEILRHYAGILEEDNEEAAWRKLERSVRALFRENAPDILPYLGLLLALPMRGEYEARVKYLDGEAKGRQIYRATRRLFERLAQDRPLVLVFEDAHWIDQSSVALLEHLLPLCWSVPVLFCFVSRPDPDVPAFRFRELAAHVYAQRYTEIVLQPLSTIECDRLARNLLEMDSLSPYVRTLFRKKAEGNPFFVEEMIRTLIAMGVITRDAETERWRVSTEIEKVAIPDTLEGVIMSRVNRLDPAVREVLRVASVIGRSFLYSVLCLIHQSDLELDQHLDRLEAAELIRVKSRLPELEYIFKHALIQEATYSGIPKEQRREIHARIGQCIETLFAGRLEGFYGLLAYHYARAEAWDKAQAYLFKAGDQAGQLAANAEALANYQQAVAAYNLAFGDRWDPLARAVLERKMGEAFYHRGEYTRATDYMIRALGYLGYKMPASRWRIRLIILKELGRQLAYRLVLGRFKPVVGEPPQALQEAIDISTMLALIYVNTDQERVLMLALWMMNLAERRGALRGMAQGASGLGYICDLLGFRRTAGRYHQRATVLADRTQHPAAIGLAYQTLAIHEHVGGDWANAIEHFKRAAEAWRKAGDLYSWAVSIGTPASLWRLRGDCQGLITELQDAITVCRDAGDVQALAIALQCLAHLQVYTGPADNAVETAQQAIDIYRSVPSGNPAADTTGELGFGYIRLGAFDQAVQVLETANHYLDEHGIKGMPLTQCRDALAAAYLAKAEHVGPTEKSAWLYKARRACQQAVKQGEVDRTGWLRALRLQARCEWLSGNYNDAVKGWQRGIAEAVLLDAPYEIGMMHLEMGEYTRDRGHLEEAEAILAKTGATLDWEHAKQLLRQY